MDYKHVTVTTSWLQKAVEATRGVIDVLGYY